MESSPMHGTPLVKHGSRALVFVEHVGLLLIAIATVIAASIEVMHMISILTVTLADLLLLFLYLEVLTMVGQYYGSGKLPVRIPLYIGIVALARYLIIDMKHMSDPRLLAVAGAILILAMAVLAVRYGQARLVSAEEQADSQGAGH
jgi:protein PsiE